MATSVQVGSRPSSLDGCFQTWSQADDAATIRSSMELAGFVKTRVRTTDSSTLITASVMLAAEFYADFQQWFRVNCIRGAIPTRVKRPDGTEIVARFTAAPVFEWPASDKTVFRASCTLE